MGQRRGLQKDLNSKAPEGQEGKIYGRKKRKCGRSGPRFLFQAKACSVLKKFSPGSADHIAVMGIYTGNIFLLRADAEIEIDIVFSGNLIQFLEESCKAFKSDVCLF